MPRDSLNAAGGLSAVPGQSLREKPCIKKNYCGGSGDRKAFLFLYAEISLAVQADPKQKAFHTFPTEEDGSVRTSLEMWSLKERQ